jgi:RHS repeat-associated protein
MVVKSDGTLDAYNDYYPYGMQMPTRNQTASADARYKFVGVERDIETGYDATGPRFYDSRIGLFRSIDPLDNLFPDYSPYSYSFNNPVRFSDGSGLTPGDSTEPFQMDEVLVTAERIRKPEHSIAIIGYIDENGEEHDVIDLLDVVGVKALFSSGLKYLGARSAVKVAEKMVAKKLAGQWHHLLSKKILKEMLKNPKLSEALGPEARKLVTQGADEIAHQGYQQWHRLYDDAIVQWLRRNTDASVEMLIGKLKEVYSSPEMLQKFPQAKELLESLLQ